MHGIITPASQRPPSPESFVPALIPLFGSAPPLAGETQEARPRNTYIPGICWRRDNARRMLRSTRSTGMSLDFACPPSNATWLAEHYGISCRNASMSHGNF
ncbi:hypothetical protein I7I50_09367 [Histoplasma capsulatum G186AR]|uniref:Uncharacterized protein n=1 Tax=Ajellomyces capsulatus TaxID=5037 RepID=A0A8H8CZU7_AJECA|nr:hypothetical protein I7I52_06888 [Histoplasma capsulatum]QSS74267.1 hypothetical protein I7I50_09367 [Histoplasma capsulatum G186AR]